MTQQKTDNPVIGPWGRRDGKIIKPPAGSFAAAPRKSPFSPQLTRHLFIAATLWVLLSIAAFFLPGPPPPPIEIAPKTVIAAPAEAQND